jgi:hypothetical protein
MIELDRTEVATRIIGLAGPLRKLAGHLRRETDPVQLRVADHLDRAAVMAEQGILATNPVLGCSEHYNILTAPIKEAAMHHGLLKPLGPPKSPAGERIPDVEPAMDFATLLGAPKRAKR